MPPAASSAAAQQRSSAHTSPAATRQVPYEAEHVPRYHQWMADPCLQVSGAASPRPPRLPSLPFGQPHRRAPAGERRLRDSWEPAPHLPPALGSRAGAAPGPAARPLPGPPGVRSWPGPPPAARCRRPPPRSPSAWRPSTRCSAAGARTPTSAPSSSWTGARRARAPRACRCARRGAGRGPEGPRGGAAPAPPLPPPGAAGGCWEAPASSCCQCDAAQAQVPPPPRAPSAARLPARAGGRHGR
jgi:hypothetical protein